MAVHLPPDLATTAATQHGRLSRTQILASVSRHQLQRLLAVGVLQHTDQRAVYQVAGARHTRRAELAAVLLRLGRDAVAAGVTTLALFEVKRYKLAPPYHVAIPRDRRVRNPGCTVLHTDLSDDERTTRHALDSMTVARALPVIARDGVDAKVKTGVTEPITVRETIDEVFRRKLAERAEVLRVAEAHPTDPGAAALRERLTDGTFQQENDAERRLARLFRPGDPQPQWQVWVLPDVRADGALLDGRMVLEYHSREWHLQAGDQDRDSARTLKLAAAEILEIPVTAGMLRRERAQTRRRILETYRRRVAAGVEPIVPCR